MTRALSIRQPWVELILRGDKRVELRSWATRYRGRLWLHAARASNARLVAHFGLSEPLARGCYVGAATLVSVVPLDAARWAALDLDHLGGGYRPGHFGFVLTDVVRFTSPIPARGWLKLFEPDAGDAALLEAALAGFNRSPTERCCGDTNGGDG